MDTKFYDSYATKNQCLYIINSGKWKKIEENSVQVSGGYK